MINESNKTAFIELHSFDEHTLRYFEEIAKMYTIQYLMNEIESIFLFVMSSYQNEASHLNYFGDLFRKFDEMFPNLNNSEKKALTLLQIDNE